MTPTPDRLDAIQQRLLCRHDASHYCPNCDNSFGPDLLDPIAQQLAEAHAQIVSLTQQRDDARYQLGWSKPIGTPAFPDYTNIVADGIQRELATERRARQQLVEEWRAYSMAAGQASVEGGPEGADPTYASAEAYSFKRCADELAALGSPAPDKGSI